MEHEIDLKRYINQTLQEQMQAWERKGKDSRIQVVRVRIGMGKDGAVLGIVFDIQVRDQQSRVALGLSQIGGSEASH